MVRASFAISCSGLIDTSLDVDIGKLIELKSRVLVQLLAFAGEISMFGVGLRADGHIFAGAIDIAPATSPATPAIKTSFCVAAAAATPTIKVAVERMPSSAPSTAALSQCG